MEIFKKNSFNGKIGCFTFVLGSIQCKRVTGDVHDNFEHFGWRQGT